MLPQFEQVAFVTKDMARTIEQLGASGSALDWVRDRVDAIHLYLMEPSTLSFQVKLAFNYQLIDGIEVELIELVQGKSIQIWDEPQSLSHLGYHVPDAESGPAEEPMQEELKKWIAFGCPIRQLSQTVLHTGTTRRYRYAFADTRHLFGTYVKIIQRIAKSDDVEISIKEAKQAYDWLKEQV